MCNWTEFYKEAAERDKYKRRCRKCGEVYYAEPGVDLPHKCPPSEAK